VFNGRCIIAIVPARDEEANIGMVLDDLASLKNSAATPLVDRIFVCDNGSSDQTAAIAGQRDIVLVSETRPAYSLACHAALRAYFDGNHGDDDILFFVDADQSMKLSETTRLLEPFTSGADLVIGTRAGEQLDPSAMNNRQRWGNRLAISLINFFWNKSISDLGPFRAVSARALKQINMQDRTFGWTTEMQIRAIQEEMNIVEVPVSISQRVGDSKISGTLTGNIRAGRAILGTIVKLWWRQKFGQ